ncbi:MAG: hypothetical protein MJ252_12070 [archaeon]|nr:hypothetical protein [archaeon]
MEENTDNTNTDNNKETSPEEEQPNKEEDQPNKEEDPNEAKNEEYLNKILEMVQNYQQSESDFEEIINTLGDNQKEIQETVSKISKKFISENYEKYFQFCKALNEEIKQKEEAKKFAEESLKREEEIFKERIKTNQEIIKSLNVQLSQLEYTKNNLEEDISKLDKQLGDVKLFIESEGTPEVKETFQDECLNRRPESILTEIIKK